MVDASSSSAQEIRREIDRIRIMILELKIALISAGMETYAPLENCAQIRITWDRVPRATGYQLYRDGKLIYEGRSREIINTNLTPGKEYRYLVYGTYGGERGEPSEIKTLRAPNVCPPKAPKLFSEPDPCGGNITIFWEDERDANIYELYRGNRKIYEGALTQYVDTGLTPNRNYQYTIRAGNKGGWGERTSPVTFTSSGVCAPTAPEASYVIPGILEKGKEGDMRISLRATPSDNVRIRSQRANQSIASFSLSSRYSDMAITRIDFYFDARVWNYLEEASLVYNGRVVAREPITEDSLTRTADGNYRIRFQNFQILVREGRSETLTLRVNTKEFTGSRPVYIKTFLENNSIRAIDGAKVWHLVPRSGGGEDGNFQRTFYIE